MSFNLSGLTDAEKQELLNALQTDGGGSTADHPDAEQDAEMVHPLIEAFELLASRVEKLEHALFEELFGGIEKLYSENQRKQGVGGIREKYGELFEPHREVMSELDPDTDVYERIYDLLDQMEGDDGAKDEAVRGFAGSLAEKIAKIKGVPVEGGAVEVTKVTAEPIEEDKKEYDPMDRIRAMSKKAKDKGF